MYLLRRVDLSKSVFAFREMVIEVVLPWAWSFLAEEIWLNGVINAFLFESLDLAKPILLLAKLLKRSFSFISAWTWRFLGQDHCLSFIVKSIVFRNVRSNFTKRSSKLESMRGSVCCHFRSSKPRISWNRVFSAQIQLLSFIRSRARGILANPILHVLLRNNLPVCFQLERIHRACSSVTRSLQSSNSRLHFILSRASLITINRQSRSSVRSSHAFLQAFSLIQVWKISCSVKRRPVHRFLLLWS